MTAVAEPEVILKLEDISKVYSGIVAVKRANFEVRKGAVNVLVGENGAGKSTLMKIIAGVEQPTLGRILLDGEAVHFNSTNAAVEPRDWNGVPGIEFVREPHCR